MASWAGGQRGPWWEPPARVAVPRRPIGNLVRTAFSAYSRSFVPFLCLSGMVYAVAAVVLIPVYLSLADLVGQIIVATPLTPTSANYPAYQAVVARLGPQEAMLSVVAAMVTALMQPLGLGAVAAGTPEAAQGQTVQFRVAFGRFVARLVPLLGLALFFVIVQGVAAVAAAGIQVAEPSMIRYDASGAVGFGSGLGTFFLAGLAAVCLAVLGLYLYLRWFVAIPLIVIDRMGVREAVDRSAQLTAGSRWYIFAALVMIVLIQLVFSIIVEVIAAVIGIALGAGSLASSTGSGITITASFGSLAGHVTAFSSLVSLLLGAIYYPVIAITMAILRSDLTWRAETVSRLQAAPASQPDPSPGQ
jgi:hypothetical protein